MINPNILDAVGNNQRKRCKAPGCERHRSYLSGYCNLHHNRVYSWGSPTGRALYPKQYAKEREEVKQILEKNKDHKGLKRAARFFEKLMELAVKQTEAGWRSPGYHELCTLRYSKITGEDCLVECAAVWLYFYRNEPPYDTGKPLTYMLAHRLFAMVLQAPKASYIDSRGKPRQYRRPTKSSAKRIIGQEIRESLGVLFMYFYEALEKKKEVQRKAKEELTAPLEV